METTLTEVKKWKLKTCLQGKINEQIEELIIDAERSIDARRIAVKKYPNHSILTVSQLQKS